MVKMQYSSVIWFHLIVIVVHGILGAEVSVLGRVNNAGSSHSIVEPAGQEICAVSCWADSHFVTACAEEWTCLCSDSPYQSAVFQCIFAQCSTRSLGAAIHQTLTQCTLAGIDVHLTSTPSIHDHRELRIREKAYADGEGRIPERDSNDARDTSPSGYPLQSAGYATASNGAFATRSAAGFSVVSATSTSQPQATAAESDVGGEIAGAGALDGQGATATGITGDNGGDIVYTGLASRQKRRAGKNLARTQLLVVALHTLVWSIGC